MFRNWWGPGRDASADRVTYPQTPRIPVNERAQRAVLPTATRLGTAQGPTVAVTLPQEVQALLQGSPRGQFAVEGAEEQAAEAAARAVEHVWAEAVARLQALYGADG